MTGFMRPNININLVACGGHVRPERPYEREESIGEQIKKSLKNCGRVQFLALKSVPQVTEREWKFPAPGG